MAYTFQGALDAMKDPEQEQANIFAQQGQAGEGQPQNQNQVGASGGDVGSISSGGGVGNGTGAPGGGGSAQSSQQASGASAGRAVTRNMGRQQAPVDTNQISQKIGAAQKGLQDEANTYVQGQGQKAHVNIGDEDIEGALSGKNYDAFSKISNLFGQTSAGPVDQFKPQTQTEIKDVKDIQNDAGIANLMRRKQGPLYTSGEAALDTTLLRKDKNFSQARQDLVNQQQKLREALGKETDVTTGAQSRAQQAANAELVSGQQGLKAALSGKQSAFERQQQDELAAEQAARRGAFGGQEEANFAKQQEAAIAQKLSGDARYKDLQGYMPLYNNNADKYVSRGGVDNLNWTQAVDQGEADRYNRILDLLGGGGQRLTGKSFDPRFGFNEQQYVSDILKQAGTKKAEADRQRKEDTEKASQAQAARDKEADGLQAELDTLAKQSANNAGAGAANLPRQLELMEKIKKLRMGTQYVSSPTDNHVANISIGG